MAWIKTLSKSTANLKLFYSNYLHFFLCFSSNIYLYNFSFISVNDFKFLAVLVLARVRVSKVLAGFTLFLVDLYGWLTF